ncbi:MAG TPA: M23 family metallopeptidase, partial [Pyrinomonadaceae bacterium]|nr:M23 family metallopeptidase [Pyrinomonadaceae bacterium]
LAFSFTLLAVLVLANWSGVSASAKKVADKFLLIVHIARLYAAEPDQKLAMPVHGVTKSQIGDTWQTPRDGNRRHEGQDIFASRGTPVLSATEGYIVKVGENSLGGQTVSVVGAGGRIYYYAHLDSYAPHLAPGDRVTTQTVLGYVGTTGNAAGTPPHLHFGVYTTGGALNPLPLLADRAPDQNVERKTQTASDRKKRRNRLPAAL